MYVPFSEESNKKKTREDVSVLDKGMGWFRQRRGGDVRVEIWWKGKGDLFSFVSFGSAWRMEA